MRHHALGSIGIAVLLVTTVAGTASASGPTALANASADDRSYAAPAAPSAVVCNTGYGTWTGEGITSQYLGAGRGLLAADDFKCAGNKPARTIKTITVAGIGPAMNINFAVHFYRQRTVGIGPQPDDGRIWLCSADSAVGTYSATGPTAQEWTIQLDSECLLPKRAARKGVWLDVQADLDYFGLGLQWLWASQSELVRAPVDWRNPDDFLQTGCITYSADTGGAEDVGRDNYLQGCVPQHEDERGVMFVLYNT